MIIYILWEIVEFLDDRTHAPPKTKTTPPESDEKHCVSNVRLFSSKFLQNHVFIFFKAVGLFVVQSDAL